METEGDLSEHTVEIVNMNNIPPVNGQLTDVEADNRPEDEFTETTLMYTKHTKIEVKDIYTEIRALKDIERFLESPTLLLNVHETRLEDIMDVVLKTLITKNEGSGIDLVTAREAFFTKDSVHHLSHVIQGTEKSEGSGWEETQCWLVAMAELSSVQQNYVAIARLRHATNLGRTLQGTHLAVLILSPRKTKMTKSSHETGRTFATLLSDIEIRQQLLAAENEEEFLKVLIEYKQSMASGEYQRKKKSAKRRALAARTSSFTHSGAASYRETLREEEVKEEPKMFSFGRGIKDDFLRRLPFYASDFVDGVVGHRTLHKLAATVMFLYFACLLPSIAFGVLNSKNTNGKIGVKQVIIAQTASGILYSLFSGQPLIVLLTTAPLALYVKVMHSICEDFNLDFYDMYTMTGLWNSFFLILYSVFGVSNIMRWSTRSINEIFALFISVAFVVASIESIYKEYNKPNCVGVPYSSCSLCQQSNITTDSSTCRAFGNEQCICSREGGTLYILLSCGCVLMGVTLYNFKKSPLLDANKREALADYALPMSVVFFSFVGSFVFKDITMHKLDYDTPIKFMIPAFSSLSVGAIFGACGLGFCLSLLFFVEQNIGSAIVNNPSNRLKKGSAHHLDLLVVAILNGVLSLFGLPWVHAALPHSPLHVRALADVEERVDQGHVFDTIIKVRENRLSILISHIMIGLSLLMIPIPLKYIPTAVLDGLFLFVAITPLSNNQMFERFLLLVTEQSAYPPNHYIRRVPQRKIHIYTGIQFLQLAIVCGFGFLGSAYTKMFFPVLLILLLPVRHILVPKLIDHKFLDAMDVNL
ncbi:sodium bicarbonate transporter-like protein 11 [Actinia tenebrosa]|uniref:Sodium bicarbonate transporter-like protein 11 n=1 Tax=Actinia tenebrosa TaxID=6105 RepID=A0A6P8HTS9_ACTTE|nr:sodium bicarbonate transporter-like protein 11 [Actinia tenebrosa]